MIRALEANGSRPPVFETNEERSYFRVVFEVHDDFKEKETKRIIADDGKRPPAKRRSRAQIKNGIITVLSGGDYSQNELARLLGYATVTNTLIATIEELLADGIIAYTSEKQNDPEAKLTLHRPAEASSEDS